MRHEHIVAASFQQHFEHLRCVDVVIDNHDVQLFYRFRIKFPGYALAVPVIRLGDARQHDYEAANPGLGLR
jgi:hypothetical protein